MPIQGPLPIAPDSPLLPPFPGELGDPLARQPFFFTGFDTSVGTLLSWTGLPPVQGLKGFDLYRAEKGPKGPAFRKLNDTLLPPQGEFLDTTDRSLSDYDQDRFEADRRLLDAGGLAPDPTFYQELLDLQRSFRGSTLPPSLIPESVPSYVAEDSYCLTGVYLTGGDGPAIAPKPKEWTRRQIDLVLHRIFIALRAIRDRKLIAQVKPNPNNDTFATLLPFVFLFGDCGQISPLRGLTSPGKLLGPAGQQRRSSTITINGNFALAGTSEELIVLLMHELIHALQNANATLLKDPDKPIDALINSSLREAEAYEGSFELISQGLIQPGAALTCLEIAGGIEAMLRYYQGILENMLLGGLQPTAAQDRRWEELRLAIGRLFGKYQKFLDGLTVVPDSCKYRFGDGQERLLKDVLREIRRGFE